MGSGTSVDGTSVDSGDETTALVAQIESRLTSEEVLSSGAFSEEQVTDLMNRGHQSLEGRGSKSTAGSNKFFLHLGQFFAFRTGIEALWDQTEMPMVMGIAHIVQPTEHPIQDAPFETLDAIYAKCTELKPKFDDMMRAAARSVGMTEDHIKFAPLKLWNRAAEKMMNDYNRRPPPRAAYLLDVLRGAIVCGTEAELCGVVAFLCTAEDGREALRLKNRFAEPHFSGMRDILLNLRLNGVICEVQIKQLEVDLFCDEKKSHSHYTFFRSYFNGCESDSLQRSFQLLSNVMFSGEEHERTNISEVVAREVAEATEDDAFRLENFADLLETVMCEHALALDVWFCCVRLLHSTEWRGATGRALRIGRCLFHVSRLLRRAKLHNGALAIALLSLHHLEVPNEENSYEELLFCARIEVAKCLAAVDKKDEAVALLESTVRSLPEGEGFALASALLAESVVLREHGGDALKARAAAQRAVELFEAGAGERAGHDANEAEAVSILARATEDLDPDEARRLHARAIETRSKAHGERHALVGTDLNSYASFLTRVERHQEALVFAERALAIDEVALGSEDRGLARSRSFVAGLYARCGRAEDARGQYESALLIHERRLDEDCTNHHDITRDLINLAKLEDDDDNAKKHVKRALDFAVIPSPTGSSRSTGPKDEQEGWMNCSFHVEDRRESALNKADAQAALGSRYASRGDFREAAPHMRRAAETAVEFELPHNHFGNLAVCLIELEDATAVEWAKKQLNLDQRLRGKEVEVVAADYDMLATALDLAGQTKEASAAGAKAVELAEAALGPDHPLVAEYRAQWSW